MLGLCVLSRLLKLRPSVFSEYKTLTSNFFLSKVRSVKPMTSQIIQVTIEIITTVGTKYPDSWSANFCTGAWKNTNKWKLDIGRQSFQFPLRWCEFTITQNVSGYNHGQKQLRHSSKKTCFVKRVSFSTSNFHFSTPSPLFNVVTTWQCQWSVFQHWKGGEGVKLWATKMFFEFTQRTRIKSVCFSQMCQHFCPWL